MARARLGLVIAIRLRPLYLRCDASHGLSRLFRFWQELSLLSSLEGRDRRVPFWPLKRSGPVRPVKAAAERRLLNPPPRPARAHQLNPTMAMPGPGGGLAKLRS